MSVDGFELRTYDADVEGNNLYHVHLDIKHPKKSTCTCPYASGKTIVCKHKVAVYFTIFPDEAKEAIEERNNFYLEQEEREREYDKKEERERNRLKQYVNSLTEEEVRRMLVNYMLSDAMKYEDNPYEDDDWY